VASPSLQEEAYLEALGFSSSTATSQQPDYGTTTFTTPPAEPKFHYNQSVFRDGIVDEIQLIGYYPPTREQRDLSPFVSTVTYTEAEGQSGIMGELDFWDPARPGALLDYEQKSGLQAFLSLAGLLMIFSTRAYGRPFAERQRFINWAPTVGAPMADSMQFYDALVYLANAQCSCGYENMTASQIAAALAAKFGIPVGSLVKSTYVIPYFLFTGSIYDAIATAYALDRHMTGRYYYITTDRGKLVVRRARSILHDSKDVFLLEPGANVRTPLTFTRTLDQYAGGIIPTGTDLAGDPEYINAGTINPNSEDPASGSGVGGGSAASISSATNLTVKGQPASAQQKAIGTELLAAGVEADAPVRALAAVIYAGIWESGLSPNPAGGTGGEYVGPLSGNKDTFVYTDTSGEAKAFFAGGQGYSSGAIHFANQGLSVVNIATSTEGGGSYSGESGYPGDAAATAEAMKWVTAYGSSKSSTTVKTTVVSPTSGSADASAAGLTKAQAAAANTGGQASINAAESANQLAASVLFGAFVYNARTRSVRDPRYSAKAAQLLANRLARASKELDLTADGNVLLRQGARVHVLGYPLDLFVSSITQTISRTDHTMQLALAWREFEVSDMEDYHSVQQAAAQYIALQKQTAASKKSSSTKGSGASQVGSSPVTPAGGYKNITQWSPALLATLNAPNTDANMASLVGWWDHEKGAGPEWGTNNLASFNPFNTTYSLGKVTGTVVNGDGVRAYSSWAQGLEATALTLHNGDYGDILAALAAGTGLKSGAAKGLKTWSTGSSTGVGGYSSV
jgi:hypothetical protein